MPLPPLAPPPTAARRLRAWLIAVPVAAFLGLTLLVANGAQTASLVLWPVGRGRWFRSVNTSIAGWWWGMCVVLARRIHGARLVVTGEAPPDREDAIVVANHQQMADIPVLMALARPRHRLGDLKWFVKDPIKWVPGVGWGMVFLGCIFVKRRWTEDRDSIVDTFAHIHRNRVPLWLISFVEGTRLTAPKLERARAFALDRGLYTPSHTLVPRTKGFAASVQGLRGHIAAVYDVTIGYVGGVPTLWQYALGYAPVIHVHVRRFALDAVPEGAEDGWLQDRFAEKDALLEGYYSTGAFPA